MAINRADAPYTVVLTHDFDSIELKELPLTSRTFWGFPYRCAFTNLRRFCRRGMSLVEYCDSLMWGLSTPLVKLGIRPDPWLSAIHKLIELEESLGVRSTLFLMPFHNEAGHLPDGTGAPGKRAAHYRLEHWAECLRSLAQNGWELACHGIDAHVSIEAARREYVRCSEIFGSSHVGLRMHWLVSTDRLWPNAKAAGFAYDATFGWNDRIGFPEDKDRPFIDPSSGLPVVPLHIQDSALLGEWRLGMTRREASRAIHRVMDEAARREAILTVSWHENTFGPPWYWEDPYVELVTRAKLDGARIARICDVLPGDV